MIVQWLSSNFDAIDTNNDGCITPIEIDAALMNPQLSPMGMGTAGKNGAWYTLIEKAYAEYLNSYSLRRAHLPIDKASNGGTPDQAIRALTGHNADTLPLLSMMALTERSASSVFPFWTQAATVRSALTQAQAEHRIMVAGDAWGGGDRRIESRHAYTVVSFDPKTDTVVVRNPCGHNGSKKGPGVAADGTVTMSFAEFCGAFSEVAIENPR